MILASACLMGLRCRYDGASGGLHPSIARLPRGRMVPVCPEQLGGLPTPRECADFTDEGGTGEAVLLGEGTVSTMGGRDVTEAYVRGAEEVARIAALLGAKTAYLRRRSPSCGFGETCCRGRVVSGNGVTAAKLTAMGLEIVSVGGEKA